MYETVRLLTERMREKGERTETENERENEREKREGRMRAKGLQQRLKPPIAKVGISTIRAYGDPHYFWREIFFGAKNTQSESNPTRTWRRIRRGTRGRRSGRASVDVVPLCCACGICSDALFRALIFVGNSQRSIAEEGWTWRRRRWRWTRPSRAQRTPAPCA